MWMVFLLAAGMAVAAPAPAENQEYPSGEALVQFGRGLLFEQRGERSEALEAYYRVLAADPRSLDALRKVSSLSGQQGEHAHSLEFADRALKVAPRDAQSLWLRGAALYNLGRAEEALESLNRAVEVEPEETEYWRTLGRIAENANQIETVARAYRQVVNLDDTDGEAWFQLAGAQARLGEFASADTAIQASRELSPLRPGSDFLQGWINEGLGRDDEAIELYGHHLTLHPEDVVTRQRRTALLAGRRRFEEAYKEARIIREARPKDPEVLETEADLAFRAGHLSDGNARLEQLRKLDSNDPQLVWRSAVVLKRHERGSEAVSIASAWTRTRANDSRSPILMARVYTLTGDTLRALTAARQAVTMAPDSLGPRLMLGRIAQQSRRFREAMTVWDSLHRTMPRVVPVALDLAYCREQLEDIEGAVAAAREALAVAPADPQVLNFLGYLLADHDRDLPEAQKLIQLALEKEPDNGAFIDSMGWVYYRLGRLSDARRELEKAVRLTGGDPVVLDHLGDVYRALELVDLAREQYKKSLAADSSNRKVRNKLEAIR